MARFRRRGSGQAAAMTWRSWRAFSSAMVPVSGGGRPPSGRVPQGRTGVGLEGDNLSGRSSRRITGPWLRTTTISITFWSWRTLPARRRPKNAGRPRGDVQVFVVFAVVDRQVVSVSNRMSLHAPAGRDVNGDHVEPVVEVLSEAARADHFLQGLIGGGDDAHSTGIFFWRPTFRSLLLEYAQQLGLHGWAYRRFRPEGGSAWAN